MHIIVVSVDSCGHCLWLVWQLRFCCRDHHLWLFKVFLYSLQRRKSKKQGWAHPFLFSWKTSHVQISCRSQLCMEEEASLHGEQSAAPGYYMKNKQANKSSILLNPQFQTISHSILAPITLDLNIQNTNIQKLRFQQGTSSTRLCFMKGRYHI